ncbi:MAG TPA: nucleotidyltransferase [Lutibacter sp.]|nr:nucleotidyltransferase [Lutibacter sp.]
MENNKDIRWIQRFSNYNKALAKLNEAIAYVNHNFLDEDNPEEKENLGHILNDIVKQGLIQSFEYTHELAWKVMKDYLKEIGDIKTLGSRDATRDAFTAELIVDGDVWMEMIKSRNKTSHTYNEETANEIFTKIMDQYHPAFIVFQQTMEEKRSGMQQNLFEEE